ncbi:BPL-N domain-containing protein [Amycolatopsis sp. CA-230715]|uniref:BPL-N domain-containing protein n=1 Tax=Amycolatopsis sp. CA-230715 TaxID=2745196 RepID=UPI001C340DA8|nr:BPL-N domain-containing protein [Amycolatopsis sp. CA-230715]QWF84175.1 hypothetical protein HUW46_07619 [Amycolatopsis sp. CA-230715]
MSASSRRWMLRQMALVVVSAVSCARSPGEPRERTARTVPPAPKTSPIALVYRGPATTPDCAESIADLVRATAWRFDVRFAGPDEATPVTREALDTAALYVQPGGGGLDAAFEHLRAHVSDVRGYVWSGGRYLGICLGGYLAGSDPGFALVPGGADRYIDSPGATIDSEADTVVRVSWRGRGRYLYFQDGPCFPLPSSAPGAEVLATYPNGVPAAVLASYGAGRVAVVGPHPEATADWYADADLVNPAGIDPAPGYDLIDGLMRP